MLTNSQEYHDLKRRVAEYLSIDTDDIYSISNPMRNKKLPYLLVTLVESRFRSMLLRDTKGGFAVIK